MKIIVTIIILYLLYKLVFDFIIPVSKTTSQFKSHIDKVKRMREEQLRKQHQAQQTQGPGFSENVSPGKNTANVKSTTTTDGEYIDFEELK